MSAPRFAIREVDICMCGMRRFKVIDNRDGSEHDAHVGRLSPWNQAHDAVREHLYAERLNAQPTVQESEP